MEAALRSIGAPAPIVRLLELARPPDPARALAELLPKLSRAEGRTRGLGAVGAYSLLTATFATLLCVHLVLIVHPILLQFPGQASMSALATHGAWGWVGTSILALASLLVLVAALKARTAPWPFVDARRRHSRALWLSGAAVLARQGVPLHIALRAAAALVPMRMEVHAVRSLASALQQGRSSSIAASDPVGQTLFTMIADASAAGAGTESLEALARWCESEVEARWPQVLVRAELLGLLLAGIAVAASGLLFFDQYLGAALG
jgi:hypothetical protein